MGLPAPRRVSGKPYFQVASASAWTTLQLIIYADGTSKHRLARRLAVPAALDLRRRRRPRRQERRDRLRAVVARVVRPEHAVGRGRLAGARLRRGVGLERQLSRIVMADAKVLPRHKLAKGETLIEQDEPGTNMFLILDGMLDVEVDGEIVAEVEAGRDRRRARLDRGRHANLDAAGGDGRPRSRDSGQLARHGRDRSPRVGTGGDVVARVALVFGPRRIGRRSPSDSRRWALHRVRDPQSGR